MKGPSQLPSIIARLALFSKLKIFFLTLWFGAILSSISVPHGGCEDENHGVLANGVVHNIAPDRKVEKIGGIMQPEPLDIYLKRLFDRLAVKMDKMDTRLQKIEAAVQRNAFQSTPNSSSAKDTAPKK